MKPAMRLWCCLGALAVVIGLAACGGSAHKARGPGTARSRQAISVPPAPNVILPASSEGPTTCTVYETGYATQVIFDSQSVNVTAECAAWTSQQAGAGYLWGYEPTTSPVESAAIPVCQLRDQSGRVSATVIEDTGLAPVSTLERAKSAAACSRMRAAGWIARGRT